MTAGIFARVPTVAAIVVVALLATATLTLAATSTGADAPVPAAPEPVEQPYLVVPDVRRQAYVFAKGALEQAGFAWKVNGSVQGYAANVVAVQSPAPGTRVVANGAPIISLQLSRNASYKQEGMPENASPYKGHPVKLVVATSTALVGRRDRGRTARGSAPTADPRKPAATEACRHAEGHAEGRCARAPGSPLSSRRARRRSRSTRSR